jgi:hypothetical protein
MTPIDVTSGDGIAKMIQRRGNGTKSDATSSEAASPVSEAAAMDALRRVLASQTFGKAPRLCSLLEFIVTRSVDDRRAELTEQQIGIHVFGRAPGYNSSEDTIVRGSARHLRQRLELYYSTEGTLDPARIHIERGGYVATFQLMEPAHSTSLIHAEEPESSEGIPHYFSERPVRSREVRFLIAAVFLLSAALIALAYAYLQQKPKVGSFASPLQGPQPLWHALFTNDRKTLIVPGDESLDVFVAWEQRSVPLDQYVSHDYDRQATVTKPPTHMDVPLGVRSATPMADLVLVAKLVRVPQFMQQPALDSSIEIRYARDLEVADTHDNNLILIGSETFNPWVSLYEPQMDFVAHWDFKHDIYQVLNKAPKPGESSNYPAVPFGNEHNALTIITLLANSQGSGEVMIVEGTTMGSTYSAVNFLTNQSLWGPVVQQATDSSGHLHHFEVLLAGTLVHGGMSNTKVIAVHVH